MSDSDRKPDALVDAVGEVPVVVRVEIGIAEMRAREWAALGAGDVVALGRKIGEPVTLRVGGVAVARGELVDLDGEVGVRILGRTEEREGRAMRQPSSSCSASRITACSKSNDAPTPAPTLGTVAASAAAARAQLPHRATAPSSATPSAASWSGHYTASPGPFYVLDGGEWSGVRFRGEDASVGLGDGTFSVTIDPAGRATGTLEGSLGPLKITGELVAKSFSAWLVPGDPSGGFTGTAVGTADGEHITGTMKLSLPTGNVLREATFTLDRKQ